MQGQASHWGHSTSVLACRHEHPTKGHRLGANRASQKCSDVNGLKYFAWVQYGHLQLHAALEIGMSAGKGGGGAARMLPALCMCKS